MELGVHQGKPDLGERTVRWSGRKTGTKPDRRGVFHAKEEGRGGEEAKAAGEEAKGDRDVSPETVFQYAMSSLKLLGFTKASSCSYSSALRNFCWIQLHFSVWLKTHVFSMIVVEDICDIMCVCVCVPFKSPAVLHICGCSLKMRIGWKQVSLPALTSAKTCPLTD